MARQFDPRLVFAKTAAGAAEIAKRSLGLSNGARRILILLNGQRRLAELQPFVRPNELEPIVDDLESRGLVQLAGIADTPPDAEVRELQRRQRLTLEHLQHDLRGAFEAELGRAGLVLEARLRACVSLDVMRALLREAVDVVERQRGREAAERVLAVIRPLYSEFLNGS